MNAAARLVHQGILSRHLVLAHWLSRKQMTALFLMIAIISSALCIIYITQVTRTLNASYQHNLHEQEHLRVERGQLLLERSTLMMEARVQQIAENKLGLIVPDHNSVVIIHE